MISKVVSSLKPVVDGREGGNPVAKCHDAGRKFPIAILGCGGQSPIASEPLPPEG